MATSRWACRVGRRDPPLASPQLDYGQGTFLRDVCACSDPWVCPEIVVNPIMEQCAAAVLGPCFLGFYNGNTNSPQSHQAQPMHADGDWVWKTAEEAAAAG